MSPRPRKASDDEIFAAAQRVMGRRGPAEITLGEIAAEAGLTAGALVQRFGSKRGLLLALMERFAEGTAEMFAALRDANRSPLRTIFAYADCIAAMGESPGALAHHLSYLQVDIADPDFHRCMKSQATAARGELRRLVKDAVAAGELPRRVRAAELARLIELTISGSLMTWAVHQDGPASAWVRRDLRTVLDLGARPER